jgi:hypothetical protein
MTMQSLKYSEEEFADRDQSWYDTQVRSQVDPQHRGEIVAIDTKFKRLRSGGQPS